MIVAVPGAIVTVVRTDGAGVMLTVADPVTELDVAVTVAEDAPRHDPAVASPVEEIVRFPVADQVRLPAIGLPY